MKQIYLPAVVKTIYNAMGQVPFSSGIGSESYGDVTPGSLQRLFVKLESVSSLIPCKSTMINLGCGNGKPALHWGALYNSLAVGIEIDNNLFISSIHNLKKVYKKATAESFNLPPVRFVQGSIFDIDTISPFNVAYCFDLLYEPKLLLKIADLLNKSSSCEVFLSYRNLNEWLRVGLESVELLSQVQMSIVGSGEQKSCFIFRINKNKPRRAREITVDSLFTEAIDSYESGTLISENKMINVVSFCGKRKTRSHH